MTNEEAIAIFEEFKVIDDWTMVHLPPMEDAINKAIDALRREIPNGSDLISRQDAIDALQCEWCVEKINNLPSAEPKTGHAETASSGVLSPTVWAVCSECKKPIDLWDNYCRSCGARMEDRDE